MRRFIFKVPYSEEGQVCVEITAKSTKEAYRLLHQGVGIAEAGDFIPDFTEYHYYDSELLDILDIDGEEK